jgi:hypothetical protein
MRHPTVLNTLKNGKFRKTFGSVQCDPIEQETGGDQITACERTRSLIPEVVAFLGQ